jgi:hypothetical protein
MSFIAWNFTMAEEAFFNQLPAAIADMITAWHLAIPVLMVCLISWAIERRLGLREKDLWGGSTGITNLSIIIGALLVSPLLFYGDVRMDAARLLPRLLAYSVIPLITWITIFLTNAYSFVERYPPISRNTAAILAALSIISGSLCAVGHVNYTSRTIIMPDETQYCWEMAEDAGIVGLMAENSGSQVNLILHSHSMISPADEENYFFFLRLGDEVVILEQYFLWQDESSGNYFSAVMETADLDDDDFRRAGLPTDLYDNFVLAGEVPGACRFWVDSNDEGLLDPKLHWDSSTALA